jgi:hypothetical protein
MAISFSNNVKHHGVSKEMTGKVALKELSRRSRGWTEETIEYDVRAVNDVQTSSCLPIELTCLVIAIQT